MRMFSLRRILTASLVLLATVPALLVLWLMARASTQAVEDLAGKILTQVAALVQVGTEAHVQQVHEVLDGLFPERLSGAELERARSWLRNPAQFEAMAFALARQSPAVPAVHFGNLRGEYLGLERTADGARIGIRKPDGLGRVFYQARFPGDRARPLDSEIRNFEPRSTPWYAGALSAKGRVFTPVQVSAVRRQLMVSLSQPVYDADGGAAGVFSADLYLQDLADVLRTQRISSRGAAFVVDEKGLLVASSAGDAALHRLARAVPAHRPAGQHQPGDPRRLRGAAGAVGAARRGHRRHRQGPAAPADGGRFAADGAAAVRRGAGPALDAGGGRAGERFHRRHQPRVQGVLRRDGAADPAGHGDRLLHRQGHRAAPAPPVHRRRAAGPRRGAGDREPHAHPRSAPPVAGAARQRAAAGRLPRAGGGRRTGAAGGQRDAGSPGRAPHRGAGRLARGGARRRRAPRRPSSRP